MLKFITLFPKKIRYNTVPDNSIERKERDKRECVREREIGLGGNITKSLSPREFSLRNMNQNIATIAHVLRVLEIAFAVVTRYHSQPRNSAGGNGAAGFNSRPVSHPDYDVFTTLDPGANVLRKLGVIFGNRHTGFGIFECSMVVGDKLARKVNGSLWAKFMVVHKNRNHIVELATNIANLLGQGSHVVDAVSRLAERTPITRS